LCLMKRLDVVVASERKHRGSRAPLSNTCTAIPPQKGRTTVGVYLTGVHLTSVHLMGGCLTGVHLMGVYLIRIHFICVCLIGVHLIGVYLTGMHLRACVIGVYLMGVHLIDMYFMDMYMFPNPKRLWRNPPDPPPYKRWSSCRDLSLKDEFWR
jgi:hypothetical protein